MSEADDRPENDRPVTDDAVAAPFLRVQRGNPTDEDLAALVAVLSAAAADSGPAEVPVRDHWGRPETMHRPDTAFSPYAFGSGVR